MAIVRELFEEYQAAINVDLCFQGFEEELATLPGCYAPPRGCLFLATDGDRAAAVVGLRPLDDTPEQKNRGEVKRLYVRPPWRGSGLGRELAVRALEAAQAAGFETLSLDTLDFMDAARTLYRSLGFVEIPAYYDNPMDDVLYMEMSLR
ncbi:MAG: GNAT family N-acetyltransferase [Rhodospirillales bacterium]|nr:GNAT family N-acetyltransferase [Alphaproteobacteria bacterium]MBL6947883.1 GNAT family N-acetyltransferase [Rhodospirillales bacterium]